MGKKDAVRNRLFKVTSGFKESQKEKPLPSLDQWAFESTEEKESQFFEKREHLRRNIPVYGIFETKHEQFRASTKNVSMGGVLINPETHLSLHENISMTFYHRKFNVPVRTEGKVVRIDSDGSGIQFNQEVPAMWSL